MAAGLCALRILEEDAKKQKRLASKSRQMMQALCQATF